MLQLFDRWYCMADSNIMDADPVSPPLLLVMSNNMIQAGGKQIQNCFRKNKRFPPLGIEPGSLGSSVSLLMNKPTGPWRPT